MECPLRAGEGGEACISWEWTVHFHENGDAKMDCLQYVNVQIYEDDYEKLQFYILSGILPHKSVREFIVEAIENFFKKKSREKSFMKKGGG